MALWRSGALALWRGRDVRPDVEWFHAGRPGAEGVERDFRRDEFRREERQREFRRAEEARRLRWEREHARHGYGGSYYYR